MPKPAKRTKKLSFWRRMRRRAVRVAVLLLVFALLSVSLVSCLTRPPKLGSIDGVARLDALSRQWEGLEASVSITWDEHLIPSITAESDGDAAYVIGLVHAHLRLAQMELFRRVSQGRLAEMAGPLAAGIDEAIRAIDLARAVPDIKRELPAETRAWLERYVAGVNAYRETITRRPADARTLGIDYDDPWTVGDVLTFGRLASVDVNWGRWLMIAGVQDVEGADDFVARLWAFGDAGIPSFGGESPHDLSTLTDIGRSGSNAFVLHGSRSASGGALVVSDPHLGLPQPNIWCVIGYRTPGRAVVGLTIPGLPFVVVGRNEQIAWTGTNMQSSSTVLYRLSEGWKPTGSRTEALGVRWWFDREAEIRDAEPGPVITDAKLLRGRFGDDVAMRWRGHEPSDESSAFLRASEATGWDAFRSAFATYAVGGQNMLYGDAEGNIGQIMAIEAVPAAAAASREGVVDVSDARFEWSRGIPSDQLPAAYNPDDGFLVSANNVPIRTDPVLVPQGNANDRIARMRDLLDEDRVYTLAELGEVQQDTYSGASKRVAVLIAQRAASMELTDDARAFVEAIGAWDGRYGTDSVGAAAYQQALSALIDALYADRYGEPIRGMLRSGPYVHDFVAEDLEAPESAAALEDAIGEASESFDPERTWGDVHRLRLAHPLGNIPLLGRPYVFDEAPQSGSTTTVYKAAHRVTGDKVMTTFGANARLLCDMGTLDDNRVVLLGGQDGQMGSDRLIDQAALWLDGGYIPLPMTPEAQRSRAVTTSTLRPGGD